ncbi:hypothetical protein A4X13_0g5438 [Tilletia indica]|uniref:Uncharacterized protein n=1 Tax=Tilletia indica TaxID=43049 RepID=A0A177TP53_9BASI|nr:hypothetical protein A4X13_0g5438 [Tilletia indica]
MGPEPSDILELAHLTSRLSSQLGEPTTTPSASPAARQSNSPPPPPRTSSMLLTSTSSSRRASTAGFSTDFAPEPASVLVECDEEGGEQGGREGTEEGTREISSADSASDREVVVVEDGKVPPPSQDSNLLQLPVSTTNKSSTLPSRSSSRPTSISSFGHSLRMSFARYRLNTSNNGSKSTSNGLPADGGTMVIGGGGSSSFVALNMDETRSDSDVLGVSRLDGGDGSEASSRPWPEEGVMVNGNDTGAGTDGGSGSADGGTDQLSAGTPPTPPPTTRNSGLSGVDGEGDPEGDGDSISALARWHARPSRRGIVDIPRPTSTVISFLNLPQGDGKQNNNGKETPFMSMVAPEIYGGVDLYDGPEDDDYLHGRWDPPRERHTSGSPPPNHQDERCSPTTPTPTPTGRSRTSLLGFSNTARKYRRRPYSKDIEQDDDDVAIHVCSDLRGCLNVGTLLILALTLLFIFAGWPVLTAFRPRPTGSLTTPITPNSELALKLGYNQAKIVPPPGVRNSSKLGWGMMRRGLVDPDTPKSVREKVGDDGRRMKMVFSDEFNVERRTFFPGDDPIWVAQDLYYWGTGDMEYYHPTAITTRNGHLSIKLSEQPINGRRFKSGMLNAWNAFCFTGGRIEMSVRLPGKPDVSGLWPAAWLMGNLGRAGYGASTHGMWPYTYDHCSVGTLANQTYGPKGTGGPLAAEMTGVWVAQYGPGLSYLPGQRLSRCTCSNSTDHPGPRHPDGTWKGRSAPELDIFEASADNGKFGWISASLQLAPYDSGYNVTRPDLATIYNPQRGDQLNPYTGSPYQQAVSALIKTNQKAYELSGGEFSVYGLDYVPASEKQNDGTVTWYSDGEKAWTLVGAALGPDALTEIGQRMIPQEPMYPIMNLGISDSFTWINWKNLSFPTEMLVDYVRVWQYEDAINVGCDGQDGAMPTSAYINKHREIYTNANLTTFNEPRERAGYGRKFPGNALLHECV